MHDADVDQLESATKDLALDGKNYVDDGGQTFERAYALAEQGALVSELVGKLERDGRGDHLAVISARKTLALAMQALTDHEPAPGIAARATDAWLRAEGLD